MKTFVILRRNAWATPEDLQVAAARSTKVGESMSDEVRWIRFCIYQGTDEAAVRRHAGRAGLPADEVLPVIDTVLVRPDPVAA